MLIPEKNAPLLIVLGPTASGKTKLAVALAHALNGEIISADSRQVFRGMDIGTGKDLSEYTYKGKQIPYHNIDIKPAGERYHVDEFKRDFSVAYRNILKAGRLPVLCGGTGMYIHSLLQNHAYTSVPVNEVLRDSLLERSREELIIMLQRFPLKLREHADLSTKKRLIRAIEVASYLSDNEFVKQVDLKLNPYVVGLLDDVEVRRQKIKRRLDLRLKNGMVEEVEGLLKSGVDAEILRFYGLEYKIIVSYLQHELSYREMEEQLYNGICQYAKRQMTFFRKMEKDGVNIHWYQADMEPELLKETVLRAFVNR